jgi:hypothetical protein
MAHPMVLSELLNSSDAIIASLLLTPHLLTTQLLKK